MRRDIRKRIEALEDREFNWAARLDVVDYDPVVDYENDPEWIELHHDDFITAVRNTETGEVRGYYNDRRTEEQIIESGGDLAYL